MSLVGHTSEGYARGKKRDKCIKKAPSVNPNFDENIQVEGRTKGRDIISPRRTASGGAYRDGVGLVG